jgi:1-acyl-sn-glycerol-3-phosphate acyltransferase
MVELRPVDRGPMAQRHPSPPRRYRVLAWLSRPIVGVVFRPRVAGREHLPTGGFVLSANHLSGLDVVALGYPLSRRWLRHMAKPQLFSRRLVGPLVRLLGAFPAEGGEAVETAAGLVRAGYPVVIMPEGARRRPDRVHRPRTGAARAALAAHAPLVPAALRGTDKARRLQRWEISFGPPISLDDLPDDDPHAAAHEMTERLWAAIVALEAGLGSASQEAEESPAASRSRAT